MASYSNAEYADIHFMYGKGNGNAREASRLYQESYPNRQQPDFRTFTRTHQRLRETGCFTPRLKEGRPRSARTNDVEEQVLQSVNEDHGISTRQLATMHNVSQTTAWNILQDQLLYPYHVQRVQALSERDYPTRLLFCNWLRRRVLDDRQMLKRIIFTDEAGFTRNGIFNFHNTHNWNYENPQEYREHGHQVRFSLNVWAGVFGDRIFGPVFLPDRLNGASYLEFLETTFGNLMDDVPLQERRDSWFMHDGAPPHFAITVRQYLNQHFPDRWLGRGGPVAWPPRSPDLNPLDFCIWGYVKCLVYKQSFNSLEELRQKIIDAFNEIKGKQSLCLNIRRSLERRYQSCIEMNGGHFEQLL